jgi:hypothetical protein
VEKGTGEVFVEFIVRQCAIGEYPTKYETESEASKKDTVNKSGDIFKTEVSLGRKCSKFLIFGLGWFTYYNKDFITSLRWAQFRRLN